MAHVDVKNQQHPESNRRVNGAQRPEPGRFFFPADEAVIAPLSVTGAVALGQNLAGEDARQPQPIMPNAVTTPRPAIAPDEIISSAPAHELYIADPVALAPGEARIRTFAVEGCRRQAQP